MNKNLVAKELLKIAKLLTSTEFDSQEALNKYLKEHPDADKSNHTVKKEKDISKEKIKKDEEVHGEVEKDLHDRAGKTDQPHLDDASHAAVKKHAEKLVKTMGGPKARAVSKHMKNQAENESASGLKHHKNKRILHNMLHEQVKKMTPFLTNHS